MILEGRMVIQKQERGNGDDVESNALLSEFENLSINDNRSTRHHLLNQASVNIKFQGMVMVRHVLYSFN